MAYLGSRCTRPSTSSGWNPVSYLVGRKYRSSVRGFYIGAALAPPAAVQASLGDSLTQLTLRPFDSATYPDPDATNGPVDLILAAGEGGTWPSPLKTIHGTARKPRPHTTCTVTGSPSTTRTKPADVFHPESLTAHSVYDHSTLTFTSLHPHLSSPPVFTTCLHHLSSPSAIFILTYLHPHLSSSSPIFILTYLHPHLSSSSPIFTPPKQHVASITVSLPLRVHTWCLTCLRVSVQDWTDEAHSFA
jgi:hypothetical protein